MVFFSFLCTLHAQQPGQRMPPRQDVRAQLAKIDKQIKDLDNKLTALQKQQDDTIHEMRRLEFTDYLGSRSQLHQANRIEGQIMAIEQDINRLQQQKSKLLLHAR